VSDDYPAELYDIAASIMHAMEGEDPEVAAEVRRIATKIVATADDLLAALEDDSAFWIEETPDDGS